MGTAVTYEDGKQLQAGWVTTDQVPLSADTYYDGMLLEYDATANAYKALATDANMAGIYNGGEQVLATAGYGDVIMAGEINETGLVSNANATITLTEDQRATYRDNGFYIKRV
jgi:hypothetical protein